MTTREKSHILYIEKAVEIAINMTPTSELRNLLTEINILVKVLIQEDDALRSTSTTE